MIKRILALVLGFVLLVVLYLVGKNSADFPTAASVIWFGLASAILAPIGLGLLGYSILGSDRDELSKLTKVTEIERLINQAETEEEKLERLQDERRQLDTIIRFEVERRTLEARKESLEKMAEDTLEELQTIDQQLHDLGIKVEQGVTGEQIKQLQERIDAIANDDVIFRFGTKQILIRKKLLTNIPFYGDSFLYTFRLFASMNAEVNKLITRRYNDQETVE